MTTFGSGPAATLADEHEAIRALTALLQQEQESLIATDVERISALTEPKAQAAYRMAELASRRHQALAAAGHEASETGMQAWLTAAATPAEAAASWNELLQLAEEAKEINRVNGTLINKQMVRNQAVLEVLQHGSVQGSPVYGPNGQTASKSVGRHIVA